MQPHGTVAFADLPALPDVNAGWMYNISDEFTTTADFKEGAGNAVPAGANIYKTSDGKWDVLAGTPVTGVKGAKEASYRRGNVNITVENIGAVAEDGDASNTTVAFASSDTPDADVSAWTSVATLTSGEKHSSIFAKVSKMFKNIRYLYKMLGTTDISKIGDGTTTGAISSLNSSLKNYLTLTDLTKDINFGKSYNGITNVYYRQYGRIACVIVAGVADKDYLAQTPYKIADAADFNIGDGWHSSVEFNTGITMRVYKLDDDIVMGFHQNILKETSIYTHFTYIVL